MKDTARLVHGAVWVLLAAKFALSIKCYSCGSIEQENVTCEETLAVTDCSLDEEFGDLLDSCFTMTVFRENRTEKILANCSMSFGCEELEQILCEYYEEEDGCSVECCTEDLCTSNMFASTGNGVSTTYKLRQQSSASKLSPLGIGLAIFMRSLVVSCI